MGKIRTKRRDHKNVCRGKLHRKKHLRAALDMAELRKMNDFHEAVIGGISDGLCVCHNIAEYPYTKFTIWNRRMTEITGYTMEEVNKIGWYPMAYPCDEPQQVTAERMEKMKKDNEPLHKVWEITAKSGEKRLLSVSTSIIRTEPTYTHVLALIKDVTEQKRIEKVLAESEMKYRELFNNAKDAIILCRLRDGDNLNQNIFVEVNHVACKKLGLPREEILRKTPLEAVPFISPDTMLEIGETLSKEKHGRYVIQYHGKDGEIYHNEVNCTLFYMDGEAHVLAIARDITDRAKIQEELRQSEEKYRLLVEILPDAVYIRTKERILFANQAAARQVGAESPEEIIGSLVGDWLIPHDEYIPEMKKRIDSFMREGKLPLGETKYIRKKDGETVFFETAARLFPTKKDELSWMLVSRDISERKRAEELKRNVEEKTKLLQEALAYDKLKTEFFANISHELKTPLNVILGCLQMMTYISKHDSIDTIRREAKRYGSTMKQNCYRLIRLVNNLLDITKIDSGFMKVNLENHDIVNIVEEITLSVSEYMEAKGLELIFDTDLEERWIACDPDKIERILLNLLSNAIKFTPPGGQVLVKLINEEDTIILSIKDTGIGIPEEKQDLIFERFIQMDKSFTRNCEGSGIGLSLVKSLVEMHNGNIKLRSTHGEGSEFLIEFSTSLISDEPGQNKGAYDTHGKIERIQIEFSDIYFHSS